MKDSYSLDRTWEGLDKSYDLHAEAYKKIFTRAGLKFFIVGASSGAMGGKVSQEFMLESEAGEDTCAVCPKCNYAANRVAASKLGTLAWMSVYGRGYQHASDQDDRRTEELSKRR
jgi:prolyl-tRNA synthetase